MKKRAANDSGKGEEPSLTRTAAPATLVEGTIIIIDIDEMEDIVRERGWSEYKPNPATGLLTGLIIEFASKWRAVVVYGLDKERGTEEAVLEVPLTTPKELVNDLVMIEEELCRYADVTATIVAVSAPVGSRPARGRREAYTGFRREVKRILESLKRKGGGVVYVDGELVYSSPCRRR